MSRETMLQYLENSKYIDFDNAEVKRKARELRNVSSTEIELIQSTYYFVRDEIKHSWDVQDKRVTVSASDVLREGVGICWAKSNLFAALLRTNGVPCGFSHQRLTLGDTPDTGYCIHSLNTVYVSALDKWIRLDARGNTDKIHAEFSLEEEVLAFHVIPENDEYDYHDNLARPVEALMRVLEENTDALYMYQYCLPGRL
ncbi:MAG: transglutaminase family protein [Lachnospiraceae bacterium]|nr:transglutaminase family protein [Lachnospiraceae bacterium]